jgi:ppGpp synthetase/RelA/SpoT-type nucleotidyltranferase
VFDDHLNYVVQQDKVFQYYWGKLDSLQQDKLRQLGLAIDRLATPDWGDLSARHSAACERLRRYLSSVPEKDMDYSRRPKDWQEFIIDDALKQDLYRSSETALLEFLADYGTLGAARLYGGVKPLESLDRKLGERKTGTRARRNLRDTWDVVRFRIVTENVPVLRDIAMALWQYFIDDIVRSRNYYLQPLADSGREAYRAIHFELEIERQRWVEVQVMTEARDLTGHLDHAMLFKRLLLPLSAEHENWLRQFVYKVNIFDNLTVPPGAVRTKDRLG